MKKKICFYFLFSLITLLFSCSDDNVEPKDKVMDFQLQIDIADNMLNLYEDLLLQNTAEQSRELIVENLRGIDEINVAEISEDGTTVCWEYRDGLEFCFLTETSLSDDLTSKVSNISKKQSSNIFNDPVIPENKNALILSPYYYQWSLLDKPDESNDIATLLLDNNYNVNYKLNAESSQSNISLEDYQQFNNYSVIAISTHGGVAMNGEVFINAGVPITEEIKTRLKDDIDNKRVAVTFSKKWLLFDGPKVLALKSSWFNHTYNTKLNQTLVHIGACKGYYNQGLSNALIGNESAFFGWTANVNTFTNRDNAIDLFQNLFEGKTVEESYNQLVRNGSTISGEANFMMSSNSFADLALISKELINQIKITGNDEILDFTGINGYIESIGNDKTVILNVNDTRIINIYFDGEHQTPITQDGTYTFNTDSNGNQNFYIQFLHNSFSQTNEFVFMQNGTIKISENFTKFDFECNGQISNTNTNVDFVGNVNLN
ncbi:hypothetical protein [Algibacter agarivorans]